MNDIKITIKSFRLSISNVTPSANVALMADTCRVKRIQRKRTKGWKMPSNAIYVGRPSLWGNDFVVGVDGDREHCIAMYREYFIKPTLQVHGMAYFEPLRGKDLACWCRESELCHADVLIELLSEVTA